MLYQQKGGTLMHCIGQVLFFEYGQGNACGHKTGAATVMDVLQLKQEALFNPEMAISVQSIILTLESQTQNCLGTVKLRFYMMEMLHFSGASGMCSPVELKAHLLKYPHTTCAGMS